MPPKKRKRTARSKPLSDKWWEALYGEFAKLQAVAHTPTARPANRKRKTPMSLFTKKPKVGDKVRFTKSNMPQGDPNRLYTVGCVHANEFYLADLRPLGKHCETHGTSWVQSFDEMDSAGIVILADASERSVKFDPAHMDKVVLGDDVRAEIVAVLEQHNHSKTIFDEWGLGNAIEYGRGMTFLFYGPPGTGKTWAAHCIGRSIGKELHTIGPSDIQSSEPGGANRAIEQAFAVAQAEGKILFIDECDSLITDRTYVGMILGGEINTLLTQIEKFDGVCILATNRIDTLDAALERRIALIVEFPRPDFEQRKTIWGLMLPKQMPLEKDVSAEKLAKFELTGGQIKNAVLQAARLALSLSGGKNTKVAFDHFELAIERILSTRDLLGSAFGRNPKPHSDYKVVKGPVSS